MRKKIVAGNWKMHGTPDSVSTLLKDILVKQATIENVEVIVFPAFVFLQQAQQLLLKSNIALGAQNLAAYDDGAYTGEVSATMLKCVACRYVLTGHSERRQLFAETNEMVATKFAKAQQVGLTPILCVGETLEQREQGLTEQVVLGQIDAVIAKMGNIGCFKEAIIAYEPIWAIGTGKTASPEQAQQVHASIRQHIAQHDLNIANRLSILYGGSVKADNATDLFTMADIDGGLIGGASLKADDFIAIIKAALN